MTQEAAKILQEYGMAGVVITALVWALLHIWSLQRKSDDRNQKRTEALEQKIEAMQKESLQRAYDNENKMLSVLTKNTEALNHNSKVMERFLTSHNN